MTQTGLPCIAIGVEIVKMSVSFLHLDRIRPFLYGRQRGTVDLDQGNDTFLLATWPGDEWVLAASGARQDPTVPGRVSGKTLEPCLRTGGEHA